MHLVQKQKRFLSILLIAVLCLGLVSAIAAPAQAAELLPQELYLEQSRPRVCTLASSTMLVRSALYLNGSSHWSEVTEADVETFAWLGGVGLQFCWTFRTDYAAITVEHTAMQGVTPERLKRLLDAHPEGIVFYCGNCPHAVFLTDYEGDTFYCADPAPTIAGERIPLDASWLGECYGGDQATILANATAYWAITACSITADTASPIGVNTGLQLTEKQLQTAFKTPNESDNPAFRVASERAAG